MIVTFRAAARSRAATRSPRSISRGAAGATVRRPALMLRGALPRDASLGISPAHDATADHRDLVTTSHLARSLGLQPQLTEAGHG